MTKTLSSRRSSSAMASFSACRTVISTISTSAGRSGSAAASRRGAAGALVSFTVGWLFSVISLGSSPAASGPGFSDSLGSSGVISGVGTALASSPSPTSAAIGVLTLTPSVPSATNSFATVPLSTDSTSMVALSVSISASTSPGLTVSPSLTSHFESVPSSMVGDSAGIRISIGIWLSGEEVTIACGCRLGRGVDVGPELGRIGLRLGGSEIGGFGDDGADLGLDGLELLLAGETALQHALLALLDGVALGPHRGHLVLGAVFRRIGHGVAAIAVGHHLEDVRPLAGARMLDGALRRLADETHVHAVHLLARDVEGAAALREIGGGGGAGHRGAHGIAVVLDDVDDRQVPELGHVEALIDLALVGGAVAEIGEADGVLAAILGGEGEAGAGRDLGADDAVAAVEAVLVTEHVHGAALAGGEAAAAAGELGHDALGIHAEHQHMAVIAIAGDRGVVVARGHLDAGDDGFLPDIEVAKAADQAHAVHLPRLFLEA